jgi:hypothetical protein
MLRRTLSKSESSLAPEPEPSEEPSESGDPDARLRGRRWEEEEEEDKECCCSCCIQSCQWSGDALEFSPRKSADDELGSLAASVEPASGDLEVDCDLRDEHLLDDDLGSLEVSVRSVDTEPAGALPSLLSVLLQQSEPSAEPSRCVLCALLLPSSDPHPSSEDPVPPPVEVDVPENVPPHIPTASVVNVFLPYTAPGGQIGGAAVVNVVKSSLSLPPLFVLELLSGSEMATCMAAASGSAG